MPRRSVVSRRPRPARLPRRSKVVLYDTFLLPLSLPQQNLFTSGHAAVSSSFGAGSWSHPSFALPTSFRPFFRSQQYTSATVGVVSVPTLLQTASAFLSSSLHIAIVPSTRFFSSLLAASTLYVSLDHSKSTHPKYRKKAVSIKTCYPVPHTLLCS